MIKKKEAQLSTAEKQAAAVEAELVED